MPNPSTHKQQQAVDTTVRLTQTEALVAVTIDHLEGEVRRLRAAVDTALRVIEDIIQPDENRYPVREVHSWLYPGHVDAGNQRLRNKVVAESPFPTHWLSAMACSGRSLAEVARSREAATTAVERALRLPGEAQRRRCTSGHQGAS